MKPWKSLLVASLLALSSLPSVAQEQLPVRLLGTANLALGPSPASGVRANDFTVKDVGGQVPKLTSGGGGGGGGGSSSTPSLPRPFPQFVVPGPSNAYGFKGLTNFDQASAGTGTYAGTQFSLEPPDQGLCVGNGYVMEPINNALAVYDAHGHLVAGPTALSQFYGLLPEESTSTPAVFGQFLSDPRCYFDTQTRRWFVTELEIDVDPTTGNLTNKSSALVAVSQSSNPFGAYYVYAIDTTDLSNPGCPCFGDQPLIGANAYGFFVSGNEFSIAGPNFNGSQLYALSKSQLENGTLNSVVHINVGALPVPVQDQPQGIWYSVQPASSSTPGGSSTEYFLSALQFGPASFDDRVAVWALTNTESLNSRHPNVQLINAVIRTESYGVLPTKAFAAAQASGPTPLRDYLNTNFSDNDTLDLLNANDDRMNQVILANGTLWSGVNTHVSVAGQVHQGIAWFAVQPFVNGDRLFAQVIDQGYLAVAGEDVLFPSIAVTGSGRAVMSFTLAGPNYYPSTAYARVGDGGGAIHIIGRGVGPDDGFSGYNIFMASQPGIARWGDYSAAVSDEWGNVWVAAEYIGQRCSDSQFSADSTCNGTRTFSANWGTFIGVVPNGDDH